MKLRNFLIYTLVFLMFSSCDDFLTETPEDFLSPDNVPQTEDDCALMLNGVVGLQTAWYLWDRHLTSLAGFSADEYYTTSTSGDYYGIKSYTYLSTTISIEYPWTQFYKIINEANTMIQKIPETSLNDDVIQRYVAAAKFMRAFSYFYMVRLWGPNTILLEEPVSDFNEATTMTTSSIESIYALIESDIEYAVGTNSSGANRLLDSESTEAGNPTYGAAKALQADIYMTLAGHPMYKDGYWAKAKAAASTVIGLPSYQLATDVENIFTVANDGGPEFIYQIQYYLPDYGSMMAVQTRPDGWGIFNASYAFYEEFFTDPNDLRRDAYFIQEWNGVSTVKTAKDGTLWFRIGKWKDIGRDKLSDFNKRTSQNWPVYRMSEMYLICAECENEINGPANAYAYINPIRTRAGLVALSGLTKDQFREELKAERTREMCFELKRRFDLQRWGDFESVISALPWVDSGFNLADDEYYPVPNNDVLQNSNLK